MPSGLVWTVEVDWDGDDIFTDEAGRLKELTVRRGRQSKISGEGYTLVEGGTCSLTLDNYDGRYDPYNASSPLYGYILPNRAMRLIATVGATSKLVFAGRVRDIRPQNQGSDRKVRLSCTDGMELLTGQNCDNVTVQEDYKVSEAVTALVGSIVPVSSIEDNGDILPYWWANPSQSVHAALGDLARAYRGEFFISVGGYFVYKARSYATTADFTLDQNELTKNMEMTQPWDEIKNDVQVIGYPRTVVSDTQLWVLNEKPLIPAGETITLWAEYSYEGETCPATAVTTPVEDTDYEANTQADGGGTDKSAYISIDITKYSTESFLEVTNTDSVDVYLTLMKLRGDALAAPNRFVCTSQDTTSIADYGKQSLRIDNKWIQEQEVAQAHADSVKMEFAGIRRTINVQLEHQIDYQFVELFAAIDLEIAKWGIDALYLVAGIEHNWQAGQGCVTKLHLEPHPSELTGNLWFFTGTFGDVLGW